MSFVKRLVDLKCIAWTLQYFKQIFLAVVHVLVSNFKILSLNPGCIQHQSSPWFGFGKFHFPWQPSYGKVLFLVLSIHIYHLKGTAIKDIKISVLPIYKNIWDLRFLWWWIQKLWSSGMWCHASIRNLIVRWRQQVPLKCWYILTRLHHITSQKTVILKEYLSM
jgi:hypothetical protein